MQKHPNSLETYSFYWSEARLVIAAIALFLGGVPPLLKIGLFSYSLASSVLTLCWIISGLASVYLAYEWYVHKKIFSSKKQMDVAAFMVSIVSGINLGLVPILKRNIGMNISSNRIVFIIVGLIYLYVAYYLYTRFQESGQKVY